MKKEELKILLSGQDYDGIITKIKASRQTEIPNINDIESELYPSKHDINDTTLRPDRTVTTDSNGTETATYDASNADSSTTRKEKVARIALSFQKLILNRAVSFTFGNPIELNYEPQNDKETTVKDAIKKILIKNKEISLNRKVGKVLFSTKEVAEYWYPEEYKNNYYGFDSKYKLRSYVFSPLNGDVLYPTFDEYGDMIAFSRSYKLKNEDDEDVEYFETFTSDSHIIYIKDGEWKLLEGYPKKNVLDKIPIVYCYQDKTEWEDVQVLIDRLETLLSNFADTIDYNANPMIFFKGQLTGFGRKGEAGKIIEGDVNSDASYLSWDAAPTAVKTEIETLLRLIYTLSQTPDFSQEGLSGMGNVSARALKLLFFDAHLKVQEKQEYLNEYLTRRINLIKAYVGLFNSGLKASCDAMDIEPEITPYMLGDDETKVDLLVQAAGGKPILSQKTAVSLLGYSQDSEKEYEMLLEEENTVNQFETLEPTI